MYKDVYMHGKKNYSELVGFVLTTLKFPYILRQMKAILQLWNLFLQNMRKK